MQQRRPPSDRARPSRRRQQSGWQRQRRLQRLVLAVGGAFIAAVVALPVYGFWQDNVAAPGAVVARVNEEALVLEELLDRVRRQRSAALAQGQLQRFEPRSAALSSLNQFVNSELIRQSASKLGVTVGERDVTAALQERVLGPPGQGQESSPEQTQTPGEPTKPGGQGAGGGTPEEGRQQRFQEAYRQYLDRTGLSDAEMRRAVRTGLLRDGIVSALGERIPREQEQVHLYRIATGSKEETDRVLDRLDQGEDFVALAREYAAQPDEEDGENGTPTPAPTPTPTPEPEKEKTGESLAPGELGWLPRGLLSGLDDTIFGLESGECSEPVGGTTIYCVAERDPSRPVEENLIPILQQTRFQEWLVEQRNQADIMECFGGIATGVEGRECDWQLDWLVGRLS